jgi:hypothetical protein
MPEDEQRLGTILRYMGLLQGLKAIPFGLLLFVLAAQNMGWLGAPNDCSVSLPLFLSMLVLLFVIDSYYVKKIGRVRPPNRRAQLQETTLFMSVFAIVLVLENWLATPFSLLGTAVGVLFLQTGIASKRWYYIPIGIFMILGSFLPWIQGVSLRDPIYGSLGIVFKVMVGTAIMVAGTIDHFMLLRALRELDRA